MQRAFVKLSDERRQKVNDVRRKIAKKESKMPSETRVLTWLLDYTIDSITDIDEMIEMLWGRDDLLSVFQENRKE